MAAIDLQGVRGVLATCQDLCLDEVLVNASSGDGLSAVETAALFQHLDQERLEEARVLAESVRSLSKSDVASLYTCLYITNRCVNSCSYIFSCLVWSVYYGY